jgi:hypothetical protein
MTGHPSGLGRLQWLNGFTADKQLPKRLDLDVQAPRIAWSCPLRFPPPDRRLAGGLVAVVCRIPGVAAAAALPKAISVCGRVFAPSGASLADPWSDHNARLVGIG